MAKINRFILEYTDRIKEVEIPVDVKKPPKAVIHRFVRLLKEVDDSRILAMIAYPMEEIILIAFLAVLGNASTWNEMEAFGISNLRWLKKILKLQKGIPSHDTFRRVFSLIDTKQLQEVTVSFLMQNITAMKKSLNIPSQEYTLICVDGKEQRGTGRNYNKEDKVPNLQTLHVYNASDGICLYSQSIDQKTNEIPVAQDLLKTMDLKGCIVTFDALHTQKNTIAIIKGQGGDYVGVLKGNQSALKTEEAEYFDDECKKHYKENGDYYKTVEIRYYIASISDVKLCAEAIRGHWGVENNLHWHLDYSFSEDDNGTMDQKAFHNYSLLNKMALSLCKLAKPLMKKSYSMRIVRKCFGWNYLENITLLLSCFDEKTLEDAMAVNTK